MKKKMAGVVLILAAMALYNSCYYDKKEELYPVSSGTCDTTIFTYSGAVKGILNNYCNNCHSTSNASGGVVLDTYLGASTTGLNGQLVASLKGSNGGMSTMPPGTQLDDCKITVLTKWVEAGAPNN